MPYENHGIGTREELRETFNRVAQLYDEMRPSYPKAVFDDVILLSGVNANSRILEIGCGTGHATQEFAVHGLAVDCVELGENMAAIARERLAPFPRVRIEVADFDEWSTDVRYDLAYSATAYHWLNPATRQQNIAEVLSAAGWFAFWRNRHIRNGSCDAFLDEAERIYAEDAPALMKYRAQLPGAHEIVEREREEFAPQFFENPVYRAYFWSTQLTASEYVGMLATHSDHQLLDESARQRLLGRLEQLIETRYGGSVVKDYATVVQMARRKAEPA